jgi:hypothetical protein
MSDVYDGHGMSWFGALVRVPVVLIRSVDPGSDRRALATNLEHTILEPRLGVRRVRAVGQRPTRWNRPYERFSSRGAPDCRGANGCSSVRPDERRLAAENPATAR